MSFFSVEKYLLPNQRIEICIKYLTKHETLLIVNVRFLECIEYDAWVSLKKKWKKKIVEFSNIFDRKSKDKNKELNSQGTNTTL